MRLLLVDDEVELTTPLRRALQREGYGVDVAADGIEGQALAAQGIYDLLILDWMLPGCSGLALCQQLRGGGDGTPVIFLTAKDTVGDRVAGLDAGADDYLVKPFELQELLARVRALLRRPPVAEATASVPRLRVMDLELDEVNRLAFRPNRTIELSEKECQLLVCLMAQPGQLMTHDQLLEKVWPEAPKPSSNVLPAQIRLLRRKIEAQGETPLIHTVYGKGYRIGPGPDPRVP